MTIELTKEDNETIDRECEGRYADPPLYIAGIRAGMERAAMLCEGLVNEADYGGGTPAGAVSYCAEAIREAAK